MTAFESSQKYFFLIITSNTLKFLNLYVQFLALNDIPPRVLTEITWEWRSQKMEESSWVIWNFHPDYSLFFIKFLFSFPVLTLLPFILSPSFVDEGMSDVLAEIKTRWTQCYIFTKNALVDWLLWTNFFELASITIEVKLFAYFFANYGFLVFILLFL